MSSALPKVLVAEDNKVLGDVLRFNLERGGFQVTVARSGDIAAKLLASETYELLITDIEMPGMSGLDLCQLIRFELGNDALPIAICSARGLEIDEGEVRAKYGVAEIIFKPFSVRELVALAYRLLNRTESSDPGRVETTSQK
jgi:DNA-binding response OmpR family regulator